MKITILPNRVIILEVHETLMEVLIRYQLPVQAICNGKGTCGKCKVRMTGYVSPPSDHDILHLNPLELQAGFRLACSVEPKDGMVIELNFVESQDRKMSALHKMKKTTLDPGVKKVYIQSSKPTLADERGDWDRVVEALSTVTGRSYDQTSLYILGKVPDILRTEKYALTATVSEDKILEIEAGDTTKRLYGVAVDVGTTSVAVALIDLNQGKIVKVVSTENEQTAYGADVISRISFAMESEEGAMALRVAIRRTMNHLLEELEAQTKVGRNEIFKMTIVGNTTMQHLFLGLDVSHLAVSPFVFRVKRKTSKKKYNASLKKVKAWLWEQLTTPARDVMKKLAVKMNGYYRYYGITDNSTMIRRFGDEVRSMLYKMFNRRSQKKSMTWDKYALFLKRFPLAKAKIFVSIFDLNKNFSYMM